MRHASLGRSLALDLVRHVPARAGCRTGITFTCLLGLSIVLKAANASSASAPAPPSSPPLAAPERDSMLLMGEWYVAGLDPTAGEPPQSWFEGIPKKAQRVRWPGPMSITGADAPGSVTMYLWRPVDIPKRWFGKAAWLEFPRIEGPSRVWVNGISPESEERVAECPADITVSPLLRSGDTNLIVVRVLGTPAARRMLRGDPPILHAASAIHLDTVFVRPPQHTGVLWVEAKLRRMVGIGAMRLPQDLESEEIAVRFDVYEGADCNPVRCISGASIESVRINPSARSVSAPLPIEGWRPWRPGAPALYTVSAILTRDGHPVDSLVVTTGFADWNLNAGRLRLGEFDVALRCVSLPSALVNWAEEGAWAEVAGTSEGIGDVDAQALLRYVRQRRRAFWIDALRVMQGIGATMIRVDDLAPAALLDAADQTGMIVEERIRPRPRRPPEAPNEGMTSATGVRETVERDQAHPCLPWWRVEAQGPAWHIEALARACRLMEPRRPAFGYMAGDSRIRRPAILYAGRPEDPVPAIETEEIPFQTSASRAWTLLALPAPGAGEKGGETPLPKPFWQWTPSAGELTPRNQKQILDWIAFTRSNPVAGGWGFGLAMPSWSAQGMPPPARTPPINEVLGLLMDAATSKTLASAMFGPFVHISPEAGALTAGQAAKIEVALVPGLQGFPAGEAQIRLMLCPAINRKGAFSTLTAEEKLGSLQGAANQLPQRFRITLNIGKEIPPGPATLDAEVIWGANTRWTSPPLAVTLQKAR